RLKSSAHSVYGRWQGWCCRRCGSIGVRFRPLIWALFFPVTAPPETSTLSLHDALPICGDTDDAILDEAEALAKLVGRRATSFTVVSNEVGEGVHPETAMGLRFRDLLGFVNQRVAAACDRVVLMVAGVPLTIKAVATPGPP